LREEIKEVKKENTELESTIQELSKDSESLKAKISQK